MYQIICEICSEKCASNSTPGVQSFLMPLVSFFVEYCGCWLVGCSAYALKAREQFKASSSTKNMHGDCLQLHRFLFLSPPGYHYITTIIIIVIIAYFIIIIIII